jgi:hypothetical protein
VRLSVTLFLLSLAGAVYGASMIGRWAIGVVVVAYSLAVGVFALLRDDGADTKPDYLSDVRRRAA